MKMIQFTVIMLTALMMMSCSSTTTPVFTPVIPPTITPSPTSSPTLTATPTITLTPTPVFPVREGTVLPQIAQVISADNLDHLVELARYGSGSITDWATTPDFKYFAIATNLGVTLYDLTSMKIAWERAGNIYKIAFSPEGSLLAVAFHTGKSDGDIRVEIWNANNGAFVGGYLEDEVYTDVVGVFYGMKLMISPDSQWLAINYSRPEPTPSGLVTAQPIFVLYSISSATQVQVIEGGVVTAFSEQEGLIGVGIENDQAGQFGIEVRRLATWELVHIFIPPSSTFAFATTSIAFSPDGSFIAAGYWADGGDWITLWNKQTGETKLSIKTEIHDPSLFVQFVANGNYILGITNPYNGGARVWMVSNGLPITLPSNHKLVNISSDGKFALFEEQTYLNDSMGTTLKLWDVEKRSFLRDLERLPTLYSYDFTLYVAEYAPAASFSPDSSQVLVMTTTGLKVFHVPDGRLLHESSRPGIEGDGGYLWMPVQFSPDGKIILSGTTAYLTHSGQVLSSEEAILLSRDSRLIKLYQDGPDLQLLDFDTEHVLLRLPGQRAVSASPDGSVYYAPSLQGFELFSIEAGTMLRQINVGHPLDAIQFSPDASLIAARVPKDNVLGFEGEPVYIWNTADGRAINVLSGGLVGSRLAFSHNNAYLAVDARDRNVHGGNASFIKIYQVNNGQVVASYPDCTNAIFSRDDTLLICLARSGNLQFWHWADTKPLREIQTNLLFGQSLVIGSLGNLALAPDGTMLVVASSGAIQIYGIPP